MTGGSSTQTPKVKKPRMACKYKDSLLLSHGVARPVCGKSVCQFFVTFERDAKSVAGSSTSDGRKPAF